MNYIDKKHLKLVENPLAQPKAVRYFLWLAIGKALGLPIAELMESINIQLAAAKRVRGNKKAPFTDRERMRLAELGRAIGKPIYSLFRWIVSPDALIRWLKRYQERQVQQQEEKKNTPKGRPPISQEKIDAIVRIYHSGLQGIKRIQGEMKKCGLHVARSMVRRVLDTHGLPPGSNCKPGSSWMCFWRNHTAHTVGIDFVQTAVGLFGKVSYRFALVAIEHDTRKTHLLGITQHPTDMWLRNIIAAATMDGEPLAERKYWVHDNDGKFQTLPDILEKCGLTSVNICAGIPDMNAYIERFFRSLKGECLGALVILNDTMLRKTITEYLAHYNTERPHQGHDNIPLSDWPVDDVKSKVICDTRLNELLKSFRRAA